MFCIDENESNIIVDFFVTLIWRHLYQTMPRWLLYTVLDTIRIGHAPAVSAIATLFNFQVYDLIPGSSDDSLTLFLEHQTNSFLDLVYTFLIYT